ncbi:MAG: prenyltransferase, partial [Phycisphaerales bacterium]
VVSSARNAGIRIPKEVVDGAVRYVRECQNPDGGFRYMRTTGASGWPRTAAGVATLFYAGVYEDDSIPRGLGYIRRVATPAAVRGQPLAPVVRM